MKPILVIPVFKGGEFFKECLDSIVGKEHNFEKIFISFNGTNTEIQGDLNSLDLSKIHKEQVVILKSEKSLSSIKHSSFILSELVKNGCSDEKFLMYLFHDDLLINVPDLKNFKTDEIIFGDWKILGSSDCKSAIDFSNENPQNWLRRFGFYRIFTNGSGMVATFKVFKDVNTFMSEYDSGVRYEYLLVTHRQIKRIRRLEKPLVEVRIHSGQDGANVSMLNFIKGEIGFIKWLIYQKRVMSVSDCKIVIFLALSIISGVFRRIISFLKPI